MSKLLELADRCEAATGPERELDCAVAVAALGFFETPPRWEGGPIGYGYTDSEGAQVNPGHGGDQLVRKFTASLDAAMTLVPEGYGWMAGWGQVRPDEPMGGAQISRNARFAGYAANYDVIAQAEAATPALALTAAALRARASQESQS